MFWRIATASYGLLAYILFSLWALYAIGFLTNWWVPWNVDAPPQRPWFPSLVINLVLGLAFGLQHSGMARPAFKKWWIRFIPQPIERSTYVLVSSVVLFAIFLLWQPMPQKIWEVDVPVCSWILWGVFALGWVIVIVSTFLTDHFDLTGLRQSFSFALGRPYTEPRFTKRFLYRHVRHPMMFGLLLVLWSTPQMSLGHLLLALVLTTYIVVGTHLEERELLAVHGEVYRQYQQTTPMLLPLPFRALSVSNTECEGGSCLDHEQGSEKPAEWKRSPGT